LVVGCCLDDDVAADGGVVGAAADLMTTIATIASNSRATTASAVSVAGAAAKTWRRLKGENQLPKVVQGVRFQNGIEVIEIYRAGTGSGRICISWQTCNTKNKT
jgi:hypothetical protein